MYYRFLKIKNMNKNILCSAKWPDKETVKGNEKGNEINGTKGNETVVCNEANTNNGFMFAKLQLKQKFSFWDIFLLVVAIVMIDVTW